MLFFRIKVTVNSKMWDKLLGRDKKQDETQEMVQEVGGRVLTQASPSLVEVTAVPERQALKMWSLLEKDSALSFIDEKELRWMKFSIEIISRLSTLIEPEVYHPKILAVIEASISPLIDSENARLFGYLRIKRSYLGLERKLQTITAPRIAMM